MTITIRPDQSAATHTTFGGPGGGNGAVTHPESQAPGVPVMVPEGELLFWTPEWRELESRSFDELARGESRRFANFREMASWLLSADDD
jgi:hypothetical protein